MTEVAIETRDLGKQYRKLWALKDFSVSLPANKVIALVGANGAGKSTLMSIAAGILPASEGEIHVNGRVVLLSQEKPLYRSFRVAEMLAFGRHLNRTWDHQRALTWLSRFDIPLDRPCGKLSGGQQTQVAMAVALGARPSVLLLDEPLANLDPVARRDVIGELLAEVAESDMTVVLSTHVVAELAEVGDHLLLLSQGRSRLDGDVEELLAQHTRLIGPRADTPPIEGEVVQTQHTERQSTFVIRTLLGADTPVAEPWQAQPVTLEDLVLAYLKPNRSLGEEL
ncbi:ABC transporter ATP-binding protein [Catenulispora sp. NF23]|uniref:ABC transporter ATP-binding protein n=1 Tax=Catenulispora pinistramenti TaxID=2705254 RepID=A0ABS5KVK3_9ACTN|nr:ABC transporter ATP-binding protein [Catenulispora pinistramenti]MBS2533754.1 ABC transporter ATP-binding protein [Catenulispora pinistramenti]MBS2550101.1 ABC transporter ATP-binding protein [Catenulispora pinistramenti]